MSSPTHYDVLGLPLHSSPEDIEKRYRELARLYQLETSGGGQAPTEGMAASIAEAHRVLSNPALRALYDSGLTATAPTAKQDTTVSIPSSAPDDRASEIPQYRRPNAQRPMPELERTQQVPPPSAPALRDAEQGKRLTDELTRLSEAEQAKRLATELSRRGLPPDEVQRMMALGTTQPTLSKGKKAIVLPPPIPPSTPYVPKPTITLPPFRESGTQERMEADRLLTAANIARRRGSFAEAEKSCRAALELIPKDAPALELYGDILQAVGRVDDAMYAYQRAVEADAKRKTAEKKYAELALMQDRSVDMLRDDYIPRNANLAVFFSALFPGAGQVYNGETLKGIALAVVGGLCVYLLGWTPYGFTKSLKQITPQLAFSIAITGAVYIYAVVDANLGARRGKKRASGWEV